MCLRNDCLLCIRYDEHILRIIGNPLFQLVGLGVGFEVAGAAGVFLPFQNPDNGLILPSIGILGQRLSLAAGIQSLGRENLIPFKDPGNLLRAFAVDAEVKDALDNRRGFLVLNPLVLVVRVAAVAVGRLTEVLAAGAALMQADTDFLRGIARIPLVEQVADRRKALSVPALAVHAVVDGNEPHIVAGEDDVGVLAYRTEQDEDSEETGEDVTRDDSWNYADILWNGIQAKAVAAAFEQLSYKEQWYLEKRNAICMTCGRVSPLSTQSTFEDLAVDFEGTTASGAERFYRRTLDKLRLKLLESGLVHTVTLKQTECRKRNKKIAAAVYLYQADNDGECGELRFDFENGTAEIVKLADWDTVKSNVFAKTAIQFVQGLPAGRLPKKVVVLVCYL